MLLARRAARRVGASASRAFVATMVPMPEGAAPQLFLKSSGAHRAGIMKDISKIVAGHGASIAATQKIVLGGEYSMMMTIWTPDSGDASALKKEIEAAMGGDPCSITKLSVAEREKILPQPVKEERRLVVECSQKPGIILAITEFMSAQGCLIPKMETQTYVKDHVVRFRMDAVVVITKNNAAAIAQQLQGVVAANEGVELIFDKSTQNINLMEHA
ncbi:hypothetical protein M885DRAFT_528170 [Pelagophyceae sp. CCMP2097]|nr:hypothetical protein M885DRAFT_528170 [Pelagophyceae sp. CCMP2097]